MKLKKILAGALALAMSVAFSVSAFAEATPGEADNLADILVTNPSAYEPRNDLYTVLMENKNINVSEKATIAMAMQRLAGERSVQHTYTVNDATVIAYSSYTAKDQLNISRVDVNEDRSVITLEAAYTSGRAGCRLRHLCADYPAYELSGTYQWTCDGQSGYVGPCHGKRQNRAFLLRAPLQHLRVTKTPDTTPDAGTSAGSGSTNQLRLCRPRHQGHRADMSSTVFAVLGLGVLAAAGIAVSSKKLAKISRGPIK